MQRPFTTHLRLGEEPEWWPLAALARLARQNAALPSFHEHEFMYMGAVSRPRDRLKIHLYKHGDTRRYLNLDDAGHAYAYCGPTAGDHDDQSGGRYQLHDSIADALEGGDLLIFDREPMVVRSYPPEAWPNCPH